MAREKKLRSGSRSFGQVDIAPRAGLTAVSPAPALPAAADPRAGFVIEDDLTGGFTHGFRRAEGLAKMVLLYSAEELRRLWSNPFNSAWVYGGAEGAAWLVPLMRINALHRCRKTNLMEIRGQEPERPAYPREDGSIGNWKGPFREFTLVRWRLEERIEAADLPEYFRGALSTNASFIQHYWLMWQWCQLVRLWREDYLPAEAAWSPELRTAVFGLALISLTRLQLHLAALAYFADRAFDDARARDGMLDHAFWERAPWRHEPWYGELFVEFRGAWERAPQGLQAAFGDLEAMARAHLRMEVAHYFVTSPLPAAGHRPASPIVRELVAKYGERLAAWGSGGLPTLEPALWVQDAGLSEQLEGLLNDEASDLTAFRGGLDHPATRLWPGGSERVLEYMGMLREVAAGIELQPIAAAGEAVPAPAPVEVSTDPLDEIIYYGDANGTKGKLRDAPAAVREIYAEKDRKARNVVLVPPPGKYGKHYAQPQVLPDGRAVLVSLAFPGFRVEARNEEEAIDRFIAKMKAHIDGLRAAGETEMPGLSPELYMAPSENRILALLSTFDLDDEEFGY